MPLDVVASAANFDEAAYLRGNPDVAAAVAAGSATSGRVHFEAFGAGEGRRMRLDVDDDMRLAKLARIAPILRPDLPLRRRGLIYDFLTDELRAQTGIVDTDAVSSNNYDDFAEALIAENAGGLVLDCGAGRRPVYYANVINYEIVDYDTTDVLGVGEALPFRDGSVDAVISIAVLEHVRDPFACAAEIVRVLKPGGRLLCCVPFLQPEHGYPHHYFNMAPQGLRSLFERTLRIDDQRVIDSILPVWSLKWIAESWMAGLSGEAQVAFGALTIADLLAASPETLLAAPWVRQLSAAKNLELASATLLFAHKPGPTG